MNNITKKLYEFEDLKYQKFNKSIIKGTSPIIGVRLPKLRLIAKEIIKNNEIDDFLNNYEGIYYEEKMLKGLIIASKKELFDLYVLDYIEEIDSWSLCDTFVNSCKFIKNDLDLYWDFVTKLIDSNKEFVIRTGYVFILSYYLNDDYIAKIKPLLIKKYDYYYVNMAIAWIIAEMYIDYKEDVLVILNKVSDLVRKKSISKINDSYRIRKEDKTILKELR